MLFFEGRPSEHIIHKKYGNAINSKFTYVDQFIRYQNIQASKFRTYISWLTSFLYYFFSNKYNTYISGGPLPFLIILKKFRPSFNVSIVCLAANECLYFWNQKKYNYFSRRIADLWYNHTIDSIICIGDLQFKLANLMITNKNVKIYKIYNGLPINVLKLLNPLIMCLVVELF